MLKTIHKYQKSIISVLVMLLVCLAMLGFGMNTFSDREETYAVKVNDQTVSFGDFARQRKSLEDMYLRRFGDFYYKLKETQGWNLDQQVIDQIIPSLLLGNLAKRLGLEVGETELRDYITAKFPGGFDKATYLAYLSQLNLSVAEFEKQMASEAVLAQLRGMITDLSTASKKEALALLKREKTAYHADYIELDPDDYLKDVVDPSAKELEDYYTDNATDYEEEPKVTYDYLVFSPADQMDDIEVLPEDVEMYYSDHQDDFFLPGKAKVSHIQFDFPKGALPEEKEEVRQKAEEVRQAALDGEDFSTLALKNSSDLLTKTIGGSLGWLKPGEHDPAMLKAALSLEGTGIAELVTTETAFHVIKVDQYQPKTPKKIEEVEDEIKQKIKTLEAPGYASVKAQEVFDRWLQSGSTLAQYSKEEGLKLEIGSNLLKKGEDPNPSLKGLTNKVFDFPNETKRLIELQDTTVLVEITKYKDREIPALEVVKEKVLKDYRALQAKKLARQAANDLIADFQEDKFTTLKDAAEQTKIELKQSEELYRSKTPPGIFSNPEISKVLFSTYREKQKPTQVFEQGSKFVIFQVMEIKEPGEEEIEQDLNRYHKQAAEENAQVLISSLINKLKAQSSVDVDPALLADR